MSTAELQRLALALGQDPALRQSLAAGLAPCRSQEDAAALLRHHGYAVEAADLQALQQQPSGQPAAGTALPDAALDGVTGGFCGKTGPFWDMLDKIADITEKVVPVLVRPPR